MSPRRHECQSSVLYTRRNLIRRTTVWLDVTTHITTYFKLPNSFPPKIRFSFRSLQCSKGTLHFEGTKLTPNVHALLFRWSRNTRSLDVQNHLRIPNQTIHSHKTYVQLSSYETGAITVVKWIKMLNRKGGSGKF